MLRKLAAHVIVFDPWRPAKPGASLVGRLSPPNGETPVMAIGLALSSNGDRALAHVFGDGEDGVAAGTTLDDTVLGRLEEAGSGEAVDAIIDEIGKDRDDVLKGLSGLLEAAR